MGDRGPMSFVGSSGLTAFGAGVAKAGRGRGAVAGGWATPPVPSPGGSESVAVSASDKGTGFPVAAGPPAWLELADGTGFMGRGFITIGSDPAADTPCGVATGEGRPIATPGAARTTIVL